MDFEDIGGFATETVDAIKAYVSSITSTDARPEGGNKSRVNPADRAPDVTLDFYKNIGVYGESDHGSKPIPTHDKREAHLPEEQRSKDIGFGHKLTEQEVKSGKIYGISFANGLSDKDKVTILNKDMKKHAQFARDAGWDTKLKERGSSWDQLDHGFKLALTSLAYNVGGDKAGEDWTSVLDAAINKDTKAFAKQLRRKDNKKNTAGMDNRVLKELFYAGLIKNASEVKDQLPLGDGTVAGIPL